MRLNRKFGLPLALAALLIVMGGSLCPAFARHRNAKQAACCSSKPCQQSATTENCCTQMSADGQQLKAEFSKLQTPQLALLALLSSYLPVLHRFSSWNEMAGVEHASPVPLYMLNSAFLI